MSRDIEIHAKECSACQKYKITGAKKHGKIPLRTGREKVEPWASVTVDCIGPWVIQFKCSKTEKIVDVKVSALTMIDRGSLFPELAPIANQQSECIAKKFDYA